MIAQGIEPDSTRVEVAEAAGLGPGLSSGELKTEPGMSGQKGPDIADIVSARAPEQTGLRNEIEPELQLVGPVTRLRTKQLQQYLQGVIRRQFELAEVGPTLPSKPQAVNILTSRPPPQLTRNPHAS